MDVVPERRPSEWSEGAFCMTLMGYSSVQILMGIAQRKKPELAICNFLSDLLQAKVHELVLIFMIATESQIGNL